MCVYASCRNIFDDNIAHWDRKPFKKTSLEKNKKQKLKVQSRLKKVMSISMTSHAPFIDSFSFCFVSLSDQSKAKARSSFNTVVDSFARTARN